MLCIHDILNTLKCLFLLSCGCIYYFNKSNSFTQTHTHTHVSLFFFSDTPAHSPSLPGGHWQAQRPLVASFEKHCISAGHGWSSHCSDRTAQLASVHRRKQINSSKCTVQRGIYTMQHIHVVFMQYIQLYSLQDFQSFLCLCTRSIIFSGCPYVCLVLVNTICHERLEGNSSNFAQMFTWTGR